MSNDDTESMYRNYTTSAQGVYGNDGTYYEVPSGYYISERKVGRALTAEEGFEKVSIPLIQLSKLPIIGGLIRKITNLKETAQSRHAPEASRVAKDPYVDEDQNPLGKTPEPVATPPIPVEESPDPSYEFKIPVEVIKESLEIAKKRFTAEDIDPETSPTYLRAVQALMEGREIGETPIPRENNYKQPAYPQVSPPYETLSREEAQAIRGSRQSSMLRVLPSDMDLPLAEEMKDVVLDTNAYDPILIPTPDELRKEEQQKQRELQREQREVAPVIEESIPVEEPNSKAPQEEVLVATDSVEDGLVVKYKRTIDSV